eukprot:TRINITY_DN2019_c1_g2_i22.p1 TRINITY_DN2019_c1_g2~~TRINITY_DN2019_c1_g2_i22.p1  ORF type:complete len:743 (+),score=112.82 TRINITY_DN2019_c1_g2_i22:1017-3245(+)
MTTSSPLFFLIIALVLVIPTHGLWSLTTPPVTPLSTASNVYISHSNVEPGTIYLMGVNVESQTGTNNLQIFKSTQNGHMQLIRLISLPGSGDISSNLLLDIRFFHDPNTDRFLFTSSKTTSIAGQTSTTTVVFQMYTRDQVSLWNQTQSYFSTSANKDQSNLALGYKFIPSAVDFLNDGTILVGGSSNGQLTITAVLLNGTTGSLIATAATNFFSESTQDTKTFATQLVTPDQKFVYYVQSNPKGTITGTINNVPVGPSLFKMSIDQLRAHGKGTFVSRTLQAPFLWESHHPFVDSLMYTLTACFDNSFQHVILSSYFFGSITRDTYLVLQKVKLDTAHTNATTVQTVVARSMYGATIEPLDNGNFAIGGDNLADGYGIRIVDQNLQAVDQQYYKIANVHNHVWDGMVIRDTVTGNQVFFVTGINPQYTDDTAYYRSSFFLTRAYDTCHPGQFQPAYSLDSPPTITDCALCPSGMYSNTTGAYQCTSCPLGLSNAVRGSTNCTLSFSILHSVHPTNGPITGGTVLNIYGGNLDNNTTPTMVVNGDNGGGTRSKKLTNCTMRTSTWIICTTPAVPYPIATPISLVNQHYPSNYAPPLFNYVNISLLHLDVASGPITGDTNVVVYSNDMYQFLNSSMMKCRFNHSKIDTQVRYDTAPVIISPSQIKCKTPRFSATGDYVVSVTFNGQQYVEMEDPTDRNVMFSVYDIKFDHIFPIAGPKLGSRVTIFGTGFHVSEGMREFLWTC